MINHISIRDFAIIKNTDVDFYSGLNIITGELTGRLVTLSELQLTCQKIADIHGQYDNQSLLNTENHLMLVDTYGFDKINEFKNDYADEYQSYMDKKAKLNKLISLSSENARKLDFYKFEISEIKAAKLVPGEDTEL